MSANKKATLLAQLAISFAKVAEYGPHHRVMKEILNLEIEEHRSIRVLDIGSGGALYWKKILEASSRPIDLDLLDPLQPQSINELGSGTTSSVRHIQGLAPIALKTLESDSYDLVVAFDLIEHLEKSDGYRLLYEIDRITLGTSIVFTPNGFVWQPPSINNEFNAHVSGWRPAELRSLGWARIEGHTGLKCLIGPYGRSKFKSANLVHATSVLVRKVPTLAFAFSAVKQHEIWEPDKHEGV